MLLMRGGGADRERNVLTEKDASRAVTFREGTLFWVDLEENPSTGFTWHYTIGDETVLSFQTTTYAPPDTGETSAGAPGRRRMQFLTDAEGTSTLRCEYYQEWVPGDIAARCEFTIIVK